jgi:hypothetical protein
MPGLCATRLNRLKTKENQKADPPTKHEVPDLDELRTKLWDILGRKLPLKLTESGGLKEGILKRTRFARGIILDKLLISRALSPQPTSLAPAGRRHACTGIGVVRLCISETKSWCETASSGLRT